MRCSLGWMVGVALASAPTTMASGQAPAEVAACEIHVWPTRNIVASTQGFGAIFGQLGTIDDANAHHQVNADNGSIMRTALLGAAGEPQFALIRQADIAAAIGAPGATLILERPDDLHGDGKGINSKKRSSTSQAGCYYELFVGFAEFTKSPLLAAGIANGFNIKRFEGDKAKVDFFARKRGPVTGFPATAATDTAVAAAQAGVRARFAANLDAFLADYKAKVKK